MGRQDARQKKNREMRSKTKKKMGRRDQDKKRETSCETKKNGETRRVTKNKIGRQDGRWGKNGEMGCKIKKNGR